MWLKGSYAVAKVFWMVLQSSVVAKMFWMVDTECLTVANVSGQLLRSCYADVGVFWTVAKELLCRCWGFLGCC